MKYWRNIITESFALTVTALLERFLAELKILRHFDQRVSGVFELDVRGDVPLLLPEQLQHLLDGRVAIAPRHVRAAARGRRFVLEVEVGDPRVVCPQVRRRIESGSGEVADVQIDRVVLGIRKAGGKTG